MKLYSSLGRFASWFKTISPWDAMLFYMAVLVGVGIWVYGLGVIPMVVIVLGTGAALDLLLHRAQHTKQVGYPRSGLISSLIVISLIPPGYPIWVGLLAVTLAVGSKHFLRARGIHIFNPAALAIAVVAMSGVLSVGWWSDSYTWLAIILGLANVSRIRKWWQVGSFGAIYLLLYLLIGRLTPEPALLFASFPWFFALFMVPEPQTSLRGKPVEIGFGAAVALGASLLQFLPLLDQIPLLGGLLLTNLLRLRFVKIKT